MYLDFYKLAEFPFSLACEPKFFFESAVHAEALANMTYTVTGRKGMVLVTGEVGAGKTFVGSILDNRLGAGSLVIRMSHPPHSARQLLRAVAVQLGVNIRASADRQALLEQVETDLTRFSDRGRLVALILDEAQDLSAAALEELRLLWNWERSGQRLVQIVLIGQPEIRHRLREPKWESLRQRIVLSYHLGRLSAADTAAYIAHRLRVAGGDGVRRFDPSAVEEIHAASGGIPRLINVLCDNALLVGYARGAECIDRPIVADVLRDMTCWGLQSAEPAATVTGPPDRAGGMG